MDKLQHKDDMEIVYYNGSIKSIYSYRNGKLEGPFYSRINSQLTIKGTYRKSATIMEYTEYRDGIKGDNIIINLQ